MSRHKAVWLRTLTALIAALLIGASPTSQPATPVPATATQSPVAHGFNIANTADISIVEGEAAIIAPLGEDGFALVARVRPEEWATPMPR